MNRLLERQIRRHYNEAGGIPEDLVPLLNAISSSYDYYERDRELSIRSLEISSSELKEAYEELRQVAEEQKAALSKLLSAAFSLRRSRTKESGEFPYNIELESKSLLSIASLLDKQIQEREIFQKNLQENQANLTALIENTHGEIWSYDRNFKLIIFNRKFANNIFFNEKAIPTKGGTIADLWAGEYKQKMEELHDRALLGERFESEIEYSDSEKRRFFEASFNPITDEEQKVRGATVYLREITDRKKIEEDLINAKEQAEYANRAKSTFLANISHELRTPLNAIIGYSEILEMEFPKFEGTDRFKIDLRKINLAGRHLLALIDEVLDITQIETGKIEVVVSQVDLPQLIDQVCLIAGSLIEKNKNTFEVEIATPIKTIISDEKRIRQILLNLIGNAAKFTKNGKIKLKVFEEDSYFICFSVSDTGIGIPEDKISKIFEEFIQLDSSVTREYEGSGLGLSISAKYCKLLGGEIIAQSKLGEGSTFTVRIARELRPVYSKQ